MNFYFAPMQGITGYTYRTCFNSCFMGIKKYYTPFLSPGIKRGLGKKEEKDVLPIHNADLTVVPQILTNNSEAFIKTALYLKSLGYSEVNLNLGCPYGTVTAKGKGAGFLSDPCALDKFLDEIFSQQVIDISVKTRIGRTSPDEFPELLSIFNRYPISELTVHPRVASELYTGKVHMDVFNYAVNEARMPLCYNGDLRTISDVKKFENAYPSIKCVMIGRGFVSDPAFCTELAENIIIIPEKKRSEVLSFYKKFLAASLLEYQEQNNVLCKMKEIWSYMGPVFFRLKRTGKTVKKAKCLEELNSAVFSDLSC